MNHIFRLIWSETLQSFVAVAEWAKAHGKRASGVVLVAAATSAWGQAPAPSQLPTGGQVTAGQASINQAAGRMDVTQTTNRAVIEWNSFNVGRDAQVNFVQPDVRSVTLNRVLDTQASQVFGRISANGQVFLSNPNGIYFAPTASVDVGGLVATSGQIGNADFMAGGTRFAQGADSGSVTNEGELRAASGGYIALLAPHVRNAGVIVAELGTVALAAGQAYDLSFDGGRTLTAVRVSASDVAALVDNGNAVHAPGGRIILSAHAANALQGGVVKNTGTLEATGLSVGAGGRVVLDASHELTLSGSADVSSPAGPGGCITMSAPHLNVGGAAEIAADGATGGGQILLGGGFQGGDPTVRNAETTSVGSATRIHANALEAGDGGKVVVWSERATSYAGRIEARGGKVAGNGGSVEVSGKQWLGFAGQVDAGATQGRDGQLLLDPKNLTVSTAAQTDGLSGGVLDFGTNGSGNSVINPATITAVTNTGTAVTLQASNDLSVDANIVSVNNDPAVNGGRGGDLTLTAGRSVTINALINTDGGNLNVTANAPVAAGVNAAQRDAGAADLVNNGLIAAGDGQVSLTLADGAGHSGQSGSMATGSIFARELVVAHNGPTAGGSIDLGATGVQQLTVTSSQARNITNSVGYLTVQGGAGGSTASFNAGGGDITLTAANNDFDILQVSGHHVALADLNSVRLGTSTIAGDFALTAHGPIGSVGAVSVAGTTTLDAQAASFGVTDPDITLTDNNNFQGAVRILAGNDVDIVNAGPLVFGGGASAIDGSLRATTTAGGIRLASAFTADKDVVLTSASTIDIDAALTSSTGGITATANGAVTATATISTLAAADVDISTTSGDVQLAAVVSGKDVVLESAGNVLAGQITAAGSVDVAAGAAGIITLTDAANRMAGFAAASGRDATVVNTAGLDLGAIALGGDLSITASGSISGASPIAVDGNAQFTVTAAASDLLLSSPTNRFTGSVAMATAGAGSYRNLTFSNNSPSATLIAGFPTSSLNDVSLIFGSASGFSIPAMTLTGNLSVSLPNGTTPGGITQQAGGIHLAAGKTAAFSTSVGADILLTDGGNQLPAVAVTGARHVALNTSGALDLAGVDIAGNLAVSAAGNITQSAAIKVPGVASFSAAGFDVSLTHDNNEWNVVRFPAARNVEIATTTDLAIGASTLTGNLRTFVPAAHYTAPAASPVSIRSLGETVTVAGTTLFEDFSSIDFNTVGNRLGDIGIAGTVIPTAVSIREDDDITQSGAWNLAGVPVTLQADNDHAVLLINTANVLGDLRVTSGIASICENDAITQAAGWNTTGVTTLSASGFAIDLQDPGNQLGPLAIVGAPDSVDIRENADLTQAAAWVLPGSTMSLAAPGHDIVLDRAGNQLPALALVAQNVTVVEDHPVTQASAWTIPGLTTVNAGTQAVDLSQAANDFASVGVTTTGNAQLTDANALTLSTSDVGGVFSVSAGGALSQSAAVAAGTLEVTGSDVIGLNHADNAFGQLGDIAASSGIEINDKTGGLLVTGIVKTASGDVLIHTEGGDLTLDSGSRVEISGTGNAYLAAGVGFDFKNQNTGGIPSVLLNNGRFLIYTTNRTTTAKGNLVGNDSMGVTFAASPPATVSGTDNRFLFADLLLLTLTADNATRRYGDANPAFTFLVSGFLPGDTIANTLSGTPLLTSAADSMSNVGTYAITLDPGSLANGKGYGYTLVDGSLTIVPRPVSLNGSRVFDGNASVSAGSLRMIDTAGGQQLILSGSGTLSDPWVGANKPIDVSGFSLGDGSGGALASNYTLAGGAHRYTILSAQTGLPTEAPVPVAESTAKPNRTSDADFRQLAGQDGIDAMLVRSYGAMLLPSDLTQRAVAAVAKPEIIALAETAAVPAVLADAPPASLRSELRPPRIAMPVADAPPQSASAPAKPRTIVFGAAEAFAHGGARLSAIGRQLLDREVVDVIDKGYPLGAVFITGHTDATGTAAFNRRLSKQRAEAGRSYLITKGIRANSIKAEGRGDSEPIPGLNCSILDIACLAPNRRLEIHLSPRVQPDRTAALQKK